MEVMPRKIWERPRVEDVGELKITERDVKTLLVLQYYGQLHSSFVSLLAGFPVRYTEEGNIVNEGWHNRHDRLWAHEFIDEIRYNNYRESIIVLGRAGIQYLKDYDLYREDYERFRCKEPRKDTQLPHKLASSEFFADLEINLPKHGLRFLPRHHFAPYVMRHDKSYIEVDDLGGVLYPDNTMIGLLVESETGNRTLKPNKNKTSTMDKLIFHRQYLARKEYEQINMPQALIVVISPTQAKLNNIIDEMPKHMTGTKDRFLFKSMHFMDRLNMYAKQEKPNGFSLTPFKRCGLPDFDILKP